jgi:hypothetical protein
MSTRPTIGDRVEHAIAEHADVEHEIERAEEPAAWSLRRTAVWLAVTGVSLYLAAPSLIDVLGSAGELGQINGAWFPAMAVLQAAALACLWELQHLAIRVSGWYAVITSQLAGNALAKVVPGGGAVGATLQYGMLVQAGADRARAVAGLTASSLLTFAVVLALPVLAVPAILRGAVSTTLVEATLLGLAVFVLLFALGVVFLAFDGPLLRIGRVAQRIRNRLRPAARPLERLPDRLVHERGRILATLGRRWKRALLATVGRWAFDFVTLLAALAAVGSTPRPALVLLAFCAAQVLAQVPVTPGGLGFVEAGMTAMLALAGVSAGDAVLATLAYRLFSYWLQLPAGLAGAALHRRRFARASASPVPG